MSNEHPARARAASCPGGADRPDPAAYRLRTRALWCGLALAPATVLVVFLSLTTPEGSGCVLNGDCGTTPGWVYLATLAVAAGSWIHALCTPDGPAPASSRKAAFWTMIGAECVFLLLVLAYFGG
ncbi:hypothetical protein [Streptomyces sp. NBC_01353]|uniref:hypothetical protein n=1 Tax=Streptomyces sp. NBC_01353 TaxID=2903835 RepID=UPI002E31B6E8|nr:hypothetical protein [Streptomyces sp. NBC_01353]